MAHGNPDYWSQPISGLPVPSIDQLAAVGEGSANIAGGGSADLAAFVVPAGRRLYIAGGHVTSNGPGIHSYGWRLNALLGLLSHFDTATRFPFNPSAMRWYAALGTIDVRVFNLDTVAWDFHVEWYGFTVAIVPDIRIPTGFTGLGVAIAGAGV